MRLLKRSIAFDSMTVMVSVGYTLLCKIFHEKQNVKNANSKTWCKVGRVRLALNEVFAVVKELMTP